jgi:hypothetical protein
MKPRQRDLIDTTPLGLCGKSDPEPAPAPAPQVACKPLSSAVKQPPPKGANQCLRCHKTCGLKLFCSAKCRKAWIADMNAYANRVGKTRLVDARENDLI